MSAIDAKFSFGGEVSACAVSALRSAPWRPEQCLVGWREGGVYRWRVVRWKNTATSARVAQARICAANVAHLLLPWCAPVVRQWLATGDPNSRDDAEYVARNAWDAAVKAAARNAADATRAASAAVWAAKTWDAADAADAAVYAAKAAGAAAAAAARPFSLHFAALALWEDSPCTTHREALGRSREIRHAWPEVEAYWKRIALDQMPPKEADVLRSLRLGWVDRPVLEIAAPACAGGAQPGLFDALAGAA